MTTKIEHSLKEKHGHSCHKCGIKWNSIEKIELVDFPFESTVFHKGEMELSYVDNTCPKCNSDEDVLNLGHPVQFPEGQKWIEDR